MSPLIVFGKTSWFDYPQFLQENKTFHFSANIKLSCVPAFPLKVFFFFPPFLIFSSVSLPFLSSQLFTFLSCLIYCSLCFSLSVYINPFSYFSLYLSLSLSNFLSLAFFLCDLRIAVCRDVASEMKLLLDAAGRLAPQLPDHQRQEHLPIQTIYQPDIFQWCKEGDVNGVI